MRRMITAFATAAAIAFAAMPAQATNQSDAQHAHSGRLQGSLILLHERRDSGPINSTFGHQGIPGVLAGTPFRNLQLHHQRHGRRQWFGHDGGFLSWPRRSD